MGSLLVRRFGDINSQRVENKLMYESPLFINVFAPQLFYSNICFQVSFYISCDQSRTYLKSVLRCVRSIQLGPVFGGI